MAAPKTRPEQEIFEDLAKLCISPGYVHAIAYFCFRDSIIMYSGEVKPADMQHMFGSERLIRTETSTLIGLLIKKDVDFVLPKPAVMQVYVDKTEALLRELHDSMSHEWLEGLTPENIKKKDFNPFEHGKVLREPIFYGGESAYSFQYRDLAPLKYAKDSEWLSKTKGFTIEQARAVALAINDFLTKKLPTIREEMRAKHPDEWTYLPHFTFTVDEVATRSKIDEALVGQVLDAFVLPKGEKNNAFAALNDFNAIAATPILVGTKAKEYVLFHIYSLVEALYEAPFYWMLSDKAYVDQALENRGHFTEHYAYSRLERVFGKSHVYPNAKISSGKDVKGEVDVLVIFGNRAVVVQAKSKRLTLEARRGNDQQIRDDFKKSIQDSCDQGFECARLLVDKTNTVRDSAGDAIVIPALTQIYVLCLIADHYPALSFQARQFLKFKPTSLTPAPFVLDVFALDAMTEMLDSPLRLLAYIDRRTMYADRVLSHHELTILAYHLKTNLWIDDKLDMMILTDDISTDLDIAMMVRREGIEGKDTPDGILTRLTGTTLGRVLTDIEKDPNLETIDFGFMLQTVNEDTFLTVSRGIDQVVESTRKDGKLHDVTVGLGRGGTGLTVHSSRAPVAEAADRLRGHATLRKYTERAETWFGIYIDPDEKRIKFGLNLSFKWEKNQEMEALVKELPRSNKHRLFVKPNTRNSRKKDRNQLCSCGSGKKYKKCCLYKKK